MTDTWAWSEDPSETNKLFKAVINNNPTEVERLIDDGADINFRGEHGYLPIHWAVKSNSVACAKLLVANGADTNARTEGGVIPICYETQTAEFVNDMLMGVKLIGDDFLATGGRQ